MKILCLTPIKHLPRIDEYLESFGDVTYHEEIEKDELIEVMKNNQFDVIFCNPNKQRFVLDENSLKYHKGKTILSASTGLNHIDLKYCDKNDIKVLSHKEDMELLDNLPSTAELSFGLMLSILRKIPHSFMDVVGGNWDYDKFMGRQVKGLTVGIIGYGRLGKMMARYCDSFGMDVLVYDPYVKGTLSLNQVLSNSDVISLHVHVTDETRKMVNRKFLTLMKDHSYIINTSRGEIVDEVEIINALQEGRLTGYATDVLKDEYTDITYSPIMIGLRQGLNIIVTPHVGGMTWEGQIKAYQWSISKLKEIE
tara:strand:+ start:1187 stop:2113 length:927 start_codon:yes stop_codon:yes gene_type:complete